MFAGVPALGGSEVLHNEIRRAERAVRLRNRSVDAGGAEADDIGPAVAGRVGEKARVLGDLPALGRAEVRHNFSIRSITESVAERNAFDAIVDR